MGIYTNGAIGDVYVGNNKIEKIFLGDELVYETEPNLSIPLYIEAIDSTATFSLDRCMTEGASISSFSNYVEPSFQYSYDTLNWSNYTLGTQFTINLGERVYFRGNNLSSWYDLYLNSSFVGFYIYIKFNINNGNCKAGGNVMSLRYTSLTGDEAIPCTYAFYYLFSECTSLISAPKLPATVLTTFCYFGMFNGCTSLISAPKLPALTVERSSYQSMFSNCTSLINPPELPATNLLTSLSYGEMFSGCTSLTKMPKLPATTLTSYCYRNMFKDTNIKANATNVTPCTYAYKIPSGTTTGTVGTDSLATMFMNIDGTETFTPTINTTFYINIPIQE